MRHANTMPTASRLFVLVLAFLTYVAGDATAQLPGAMGNYAVGHLSVNPDDDPSLRNRFLYLWYPVDAEDTVGASQTQYMLSDLEFPSEHAFDDVPAADDGPLPLVIYYHGSGAWGAQQPSLAETLASHGIVVAGLDNGPGSRSMIALLEDISTRPNHPLFGKIDTDTVGLVGFSMGADSTITGDTNERIKAVMPISVGADNRRSTTPMFILTGTLDSRRDSSRRTFARRQGGDRYLASIEGAGHLSFVESCTRIEYADEHYGMDNLAGYRNLTHMACMDRHIPNQEAIDLTNFYAAAFFGRHLLGDESFGELLTADYAINNDFPVRFEAVPADARAGDANLDGRFNSSDLVQVFQDGLFEVNRTAAVTWRSGDWSADARFDSADLVLAFQEGWYEAGAANAQSVPEPAACTLLFVGLLGIAMRRRYVAR